MSTTGRRNFEGTERGSHHWRLSSGTALSRIKKLPPGLRYRIKIVRKIWIDWQISWKKCNLSLLGGYFFCEFFGGVGQNFRKGRVIMRNIHQVLYGSAKMHESDNLVNQFSPASGPTIWPPNTSPETGSHKIFTCPCVSPRHMDLPWSLKG